MDKLRVLNGNSEEYSFTNQFTYLALELSEMNRPTVLL